MNLRMSILKVLAISSVTCLLITACSNQSFKDQKADLEKLGDLEPILIKNEEYFKWEVEKLNEFPQKSEIEEYDLRWKDLHELDLKNESEKLFLSAFSIDTIWPSILPDSFDPQEILELNKNPGLNVRKLHEQGITGKNIGIAIIDQALLLEHEEYQPNIMLYELLHSSDTSAQMHGAAVTSIACGKNIGVAPDAKIYYISSTFGKIEENGEFEIDLKPVADGIYRVLEMNKHLPEGNKIRVISISIGLNRERMGYQEVIEAIEEAKKEGVFVITVSTEENYNFSLMGLGRHPMSDPDKNSSYEPGFFFAESFYLENDFYQGGDLLFVPMDSRTIAGFTDPKDYAFSRIGGMSWTCPWLAGMYALCVQVDPEITADEFIQIALETGHVQNIQHDGKDYKLGRIIDPEKIIEQLKNKKQG
ncbi:MAG: S8 family serine peptidase [Peptostreptococcaceae bacterium]|nr:S8 family serine peptidase [Peptostreptococcaceae bacterium]